MKRQILQDIINDFDEKKFTPFFRLANTKFCHPNEPIYCEDENFGEGKRLKEVNLEDGDLMVCSIPVKKSLTERTGKKAQYELGKKILKDRQTDAGIFIFYDENGSFRFSLIYANYLGKRRDWSTFRRFTYFVSKELTNKTFLQRIADGDFSSLEKIKEAFSVEKVTKEFYEDIASWYFWAVENSKFPKDAEEDKKNGRNVAVIRLITRMIFIWFMRERGLVPRKLFEENNIRQVLKNVSPDDSTYYKAILQNLFFATLNTKKDERQFRSEKRFYKGWNKDFGIQYVYRYHNLFADQEKMEEYFCSIPFLNGGLFDCLDDGKNDIYVDGFTERKKEYQPKVPNFLFFSGETNADLNSYYGTKNKTYKVQGLFNILSSFNFTIDENSPDDADIALDPELLGRVFENLLASFNPETSTTARKATGSYYTPREIVDYMVTESLKAYFKTSLAEIKDIDEKLDILFSKETDENPFDKTESKKLVGLIENARIVDPAVGSGAFPMGALNKMVFVLNKVDPRNELWKQAQLETADTMTDPQVRKATKKQIEEFFKEKNADYGRKLYLIQKCIYGVDIQQIAVEIAKLRFFISLLVDEKIDKDKENWGVEALPNLDFKIMQGNSLISEFLGIDFDNGNGEQKEQTGLGFEREDDNLIKEFERKKFDFQNESDREKKKKLKDEVEDLMIRIFEEKLQKKYAEFKPLEERAQNIPNPKTRAEYLKAEKTKVAQKHGVDLENIEEQLREFSSKNKIRPFFPWKLYFAEVFEKGGFDVVIGNPPYVSALEAKKIIDPQIREKYKERFVSAKGAYDLYILFFEQGILILRNKGVLTYISPSKYLSANYAFALREFILNYSLLELVDFSTMKTFESSNVSTIVTLIQKIDTDSPVRTVKFESLNYFKKQVFENKRKYLTTLPENIWGFLLSNHINLLTKIQNQSFSLNNVAKVNASSTAGEADTYSNYITETRTPNSLKMINTRTIDHIYNHWGRIKYRNQGTNILKPFLSLDNINPRRIRMYKFPKLIFSKVAKSITASYDKNGEFASTNTNFVYSPEKTFTLEFLTAYLNSSLADFIYKQFFGGLRMFSSFQFQAPQLRIMPVPKNPGNQKPFIDLVDKILSITKDDDYLDNPDKQAKVKEYEKQIDQLVYKLYSLTSEEIKIVEGNA